MLRMDECEGFEWDSGNIDKNFILHDVTNTEAEQMFFNAPLITAADVAHSSSEGQRYKALGHTDNNRHLFAVFTIRNGYIRIISVRDMSRKERKIYDEKA